MKTYSEQISQNGGEELMSSRQGFLVLWPARRGFLPIDEVRIGDEVLTTDRSYHPVECTMRHTANEIIYLRAQGMYKELKCTPNHPFYARSKRRYYENGTIKTVYGKRNM